MYGGDERKLGFLDGKNDTDAISGEVTKVNVVTEWVGAISRGGTISSLSR